MEFKTRECMLKAVSLDAVVVSAKLPVPEGLDWLDQCRQSIVDSRGRVKDAEDNIRNEALRYLMDASGEELLSRARYLYWSAPDIPAALIASVVVGLPQPSKLLDLIGRDGVEIECLVCGSSIKIQSRSKLQEVNSVAKGRNAFWCNRYRTCDACIEARRQSDASRDQQSQQQEQARDMELHTMPYREYLVTKEWLETRNRKLRQSGYACQLCNKRGLLDVHHRTYERRGFEEMIDLIVLCRPCHAKFHGKEK